MNSIKKDKNCFDNFKGFIIFAKPKEIQTGQSSPPFGCLVSKGVSKGKLRSKIFDIQRVSGYGS